MGLPPGTGLGVYEIVSPLGAGGMGEVYRARDTQLKRNVALKTLPSGVTGDADRLARFQREAEVLAALNHPNIAQIHGVADGQVSGVAVRALVMELVEGDDLAQRITGGAVPIPEALTIARQIALALDYAHERGIVHRDLKPANIKVTPDGHVKVLDFGLAKAIDQRSGIGDQGSGRAADSPTLTSPAMTERGMILGTAAYMSPEQARGKVVDKRSDSWAFGCVVYEMITGKRTFDGEDVTDSIVAVMSRDPSWQSLPPTTPPALRKLFETLVTTFPDRRQTWPLTTEGGQVIGWRADGREILVATLSGHIAAYPVTTGPAGFSAGPSTILVRDVGSLAPYSSATPDHSRILIRTNPDASRDRGEIRLLFNWTSRLGAARP